MNDETYIVELAKFLEKEKAQYAIEWKELEKEKAQYATEWKELNNAINAGKAREFLLAKGPYKRHRHPPPICASGYAHPSCSKYGPHALCTFGFESGNCVCLHWP